MLNLPREIGFCNSGRAESLKGDWLLQQWACSISQGRLGFATVGVLNLSRKIGFCNSGRAESPKGDWFLQQWAC